MRKNCLIPSDLVPKCPVCGGPMTMNLRCDQYFIEDEDWHKAAEAYERFLNRCIPENTVLLELGVGFNTPGIIRFSFEKIVREQENISMIRVNFDEAVIPKSFGKRAVGINADLGRVLIDLEYRMEKMEPGRK